MFQEKDIADYYNQTIDHYKIWWNMDANQALHFGYWDQNTKNFDEALRNTNKVMASLAEIKPTDMVLDAGCGVGGTAFYLAKNIGCHVSGITLSQKQHKLALQYRQQFQLEDKTNFSIQNFLKTEFEPNTFDVYWACESSCHAADKMAFLSEAKRILKPGARMVIADYFLTELGKKDADGHMKHWGDLWAIDTFHTKENFIDEAEMLGFTIIHNKDISAHVWKSARRMYWSYLIGIIPSRIYNFFHNTSRFGKYHYRSGYYQYQSLKQGLWQYRMVVLKLNSK